MADQSDFIPYAKQSIDDDDIAAVVNVLRSAWLTSGPTVKIFEAKVSSFCGAQEAVAVATGTAGLHAALYAAGIGPGDEVIVPPLTFVASANAALYLGATPVFADIHAGNLSINPTEVERRITPRTRAIMAVDYAGQPCDYSALREIALKHNLVIVADACHSIGAEFNGKNSGLLADLSVFSFHPVKHITTGEGGMVLTDNPEYAKRMRIFRNHGINTDHRQRAESGTLSYEMLDLGFNYRISDFQCALGISQLEKLPSWIERRREIASIYSRAFAGHSLISPQEKLPGSKHAYHLFVVKIALEKLAQSRDQIAKKLRASGVGVNVHYPPVHLHPYYQKKFGFKPGDYPVTEFAYERLLSLPMYHSMADRDVERVIEVLNGALDAALKK